MKRVFRLAVIVIVTLAADAGFGGQSAVAIDASASFKNCTEHLNALVRLSRTGRAIPIERSRKSLNLEYRLCLFGKTLDLGCAGKAAKVTVRVVSHDCAEITFMEQTPPRTEKPQTTFDDVIDQLLNKRQ